MVKHILLSTLVYLRSSFDWIIDLIFSFIYDNSKSIEIPHVKNSILDESAVSLARKIRSKELSSETVVKAFIEQISVVNPVLNCVVDDRFNEAIKEALDVDKFLATTELTVHDLEKQKPFLGVPFTSKESVAAKGMKFTFGLLSRRNEKATEDSAIIENTKRSGAILIAVTNIPEINLWCETRNNLYGQTLNPYNINRTVGGSSGGEACLLAACGTPLSLGTDIGGSIRMPAYFCGVFGHLPTNGLISTKGMTFRTGEEKATMVNGGPLTKYVEDIIPSLKVILGDKANKLRLDSEVDLKKINVLYIEEPGDFLISPICKDVKNAIKKAADHLSNICESSAQKITLPGFKYSYKIWKHGMSKEPGNFAYELSNKKKEVSLYTELLRMLTGCSQFTLPPLLRLIDVQVMPQVDSKWGDQITAKLRDELLKELGENGVLLFPSCPQTAPYHYASFFRPYNFSYWAVFNALKLPVTQVPLGLNSKGLPVGIQVVGAPYNDHVCIAVAKELEKAFGGWVSPFSSQNNKND